MIHGVTVFVHGDIRSVTEKRIGCRVFSIIKRKNPKLKQQKLSTPLYKCLADNGKNETKRKKKMEMKL